MLKELGRRFGSDKFRDDIHGHAYEEVYEYVVGHMRNSPIKLLEIGVFQGSSLRIWGKYFPIATIDGIDIAPELIAFEQSDNVRVFRADAYTKETVDELPNYDVIIDDGPHTLESQLFTIEHYLPKVNPGGVLIIEDIKHESWKYKLYEAVPSYCEATLHWYDLVERNGRDDDRILVVQMK